MDNFNTGNITDNSGNNFIEKARKFFSVPKIIFAILGVIILVEVIYAVSVLSSPTPSAAPVRRPATVISAGRISLTVPKVNFAVNETVPVSVMVDSGGRTLNGADLIVRFDPKVLEATPGSLIAGSIFDEYPLLSADMKKGLLSVSGVDSLRTGFKGIGRFITVNFKVKAKGNTSLSIDFTKDSTSDSNLVEQGTSKDILENIDNLELNIQ